MITFDEIEYESDRSASCQISVTYVGIASLGADGHIKAVSQAAGGNPADGAFASLLVDHKLNQSPVTVGGIDHAVGAGNNLTS